MHCWDEVVGQLGKIPDLSGARCRGRSELFDQTIIGARGASDTENLVYARTAALRLCAQCPALGPCSAWVDNLPTNQRPPGVIAGRINKPGDTMTEPTEPPRVSVPTRLGDGIFTDNEYVDAEPEAAGQWDARQWHDELFR